MKHRLKSYLLMLAAAIASPTFFASSQTTIAIDGANYTVNTDGSASLTEVTDKAKTVFTIAAKVSGGGKEYEVKAVDNNAFEGCSALTDLHIETSAQPLKIGNRVDGTLQKGMFDGSSLTTLSIERNIDYHLSPFEGLESLTKVTFADGVTELGKSMFADCKNLAEVKMPRNLKKIGGSAFRQCENLREIDMPASLQEIGDNVFYRCISLEKVNITDLAAWSRLNFSYGDNNPLKSAHHLYLNGTEITHLVLPENVDAIGNYAFAGCYGLKSITTGDNLTSIGANAFEGCYAINRIALGDRLEKIGNKAFSGCNNIDTFVVGSSCKSFGYDAFAKCQSISTVEIQNLALFCSASFSSNNSNPLYFAQKAVVDGVEISHLSIPEDVNEISNYAFYGFKGLKTVKMSSSVKKIGSRAFRECSNLAGITLGDGVEQIGSGAFYKCGNLKEINIAAKVPPTLKSDSFSDTHFSDATLNVPSGSLDDYRNDATWGRFAKIQEKDFSGVDNAATVEIGIAVEAGMIVVKGNAAYSYKEVFNIAGKKVYAGTSNRIAADARGIYIVRIAGKTFKVSL